MSDGWKHEASHNEKAKWLRDEHAKLMAEVEARKNPPVVEAKPKPKFMGRRK
jgi:hypothetical protein